MTEDRPAAFVLTGAFSVICRNPLYLEDLRSRGLRVLVITAAGYAGAARAATADPHHPAALIEDVGFVEGALDAEGSFTAGVVAVARRWQGAYDIVGVYAVGETLVEPTGLLADALGLPSPGLRATRVCRSKYLQRFYLPGFSPEVVVLPSGDRSFDPAEVVFPAVVKPATRHSSSGVATAADAAALRELLPQYPEHETLLVERKVAGQEYSVESLVHDGEVVFASVTRKETTDAHADTFVELAHSVPAERTADTDALLAANAELLARLAFENGVAHSEWRVDGTPRLMEVAARTPGDGLLVLYQLATGAALEPAILRLALGEPVQHPAPTRYARQVYLQHPEGVLEEVSLDWPGVRPQWIGGTGVWPEVKPGLPADPPTLRAVLVLKPRGSALGPLRSSDDRAVSFLVDAATPAELDALDLAVRAALTVVVRP